MSEPSYNAATCAPAHSPINVPIDLGIELGFIKGNTLTYASTHIKIIYDLCLEQLSICQLPPRCIRIFNMILRQTIGFKKREDNATTTRLEQLTKIRHDHVGEGIRYLSQRNIIKWRKGGKFNNYLSINFDFSSWGQCDPKKQNPNNDPTGLLPEHYRQPIDQGLSFDNDFDEMDNTFSDDNFQNNEKFPAQETTTKPAQTTKIESCNTEKIVKEQTIKSQSLKSDNTEKNQDSEKKTKQASKQKPAMDANMIQIDSKEYQQLKKLEAEHTQFNQNKTILEQQLFERQQQSEIQQKNIQTYTQEISELKQYTEQVQAENTHLKNKNMNQHIQNNQHHINVQTPDYSQQSTSVTPTVSPSKLAESIADLNYPEQLNPHEQQALKALLFKASNQERLQDVLNLLDIRLSNTQKPLNNTVGYFARLLQKHAQGELDFSALKSFKNSQTIRDEKVINQGLQDLIGLLFEHHLQVQHYERLMTECKTRKSDSEANRKRLARYQHSYSENHAKAVQARQKIFQYVQHHQLDKNLISHI
jgi:phage replication O-like protein O